MESRKGAGTSTIIQVIVVVLTMSAFIMLFQSCTKNAEDQSEGMACWSALNLNYLNMEGVTGDYVHKACKTIYKPLITDDVATPEGIKHEVAMNMARAWKITHEGSLGTGMWNDRLVSLFKNDNECMIIYKLTFNPTPLFRETYPGITYDAMKVYFSTTEFAKFPRKDGVKGNIIYTFEEYIQSKGGEGVYWFAEDGLKLVKPGQVYAIAIASPKSTVFSRSKMPTTESNIVIFSTFNYAVREVGCREFVD